MLNVEKTNLLAKFDIVGEAFETINYRVPNATASIFCCFNGQTGAQCDSVKDENGQLFDFCGQTLYFELMLL